ncbi:prepilin-type N-terminal cleavage/methylation domain-containing protein [Providencia sp. wls1943]|jgi:prepilin peptidase dependent protein C|uniref:Prepilin-type N-terminal cleavage/methylation domain-containing protein n=1 Tax=Providencia zhijiangensis TaxID=3053982 RepID=A0ABZ0MZS1_9GAMM|nr:MULTISPECIES: type II secretion system protein [unclassified Providencia]MTB66728.1 prepilin-type N-terminal cleavage/methylation domain-containing protein [Providencia sp. wls1943]MTC71047.1 prepilin-type N-terminal cleavage/methylation domain-containing protein [Providencia sp. wls1914]MTC75031.1 prepilin-type N-terminal cleavage/methylation domain-containing protein [Providencia sp. wls1919]WPA91548.1 prepilin-type N-terminal cleavage/methylation domain-containing protein [Providencia sp.
MKNSQQGFALVESMIAVVVFAILLIALLNYSQYIALNFNQIYQGSQAVRSLHGTLEGKRSSNDKVPLEIGYQPQREQIKIVHSTILGNCSESKVSLLVGGKLYSISRWMCAKGESHVSGLSF